MISNTQQISHWLTGYQQSRSIHLEDFQRNHTKPYTVQLNFIIAHNNCRFYMVYLNFSTYSHIGGGQGGLNLPLPVPFNPGSRPVFFHSRPFAFFRLRNIARCCIIFPFFSRFPPPWESRFLPPLLPPPVHLPPPFLPVSRPPVHPPHIHNHLEVFYFAGFLWLITRILTITYPFQCSQYMEIMMIQLG